MMSRCQLLMVRSGLKYLDYQKESIWNIKAIRAEIRTTYRYRLSNKLQKLLIHSKRISNKFLADTLMFMVIKEHLANKKTWLNLIQNQKQKTNKKEAVIEREDFWMSLNRKHLMTSLASHNPSLLPMPAWLIITTKIRIWTISNHLFRHLTTTLTWIRTRSLTLYLIWSPKKKARILLYKKKKHHSVHLFLIISNHQAQISSMTIIQ